MLSIKRWFCGRDALRYLLNEGFGDNIIHKFKS
jgi:hypothetical protein